MHTRSIRVSTTQFTPPQKVEVLLLVLHAGLLGALTWHKQRSNGIFDGLALVPYNMNQVVVTL